jgi:C4-dicarboxylate-binding protein DctP
MITILVIIYAWGGTVNKVVGVVVLIFANLLAGAVVAECDSGEQIIRMSHINRPYNHPIGDAASELEKRVNSEMNGIACMEVFGNSLLYTDDRVVRALLENDIQIAVPSYGALDEYTRTFRVFGLPFVFKNISAVGQFQESAAARSLLIGMRGFGIRGLDFWQTGMLQMSANTALKVPNKARNLTFRSTGSTVSNVQFAAMGAYARPISFASLYGALQSGELDGAEESWANFLDKKIFEVQSDLTETNHAVGGNVLIVSYDWYKNLDPTVRNPLLNIIQEVSKKQRDQVADREYDAKTSILEQQGNIVELTKLERQEWRDELSGVFQHFSNEVNPVFVRLIDRINADN